MNQLAILLCSACFFTAVCAAPEIFKEEYKPCDPECTKHGNCNGETGQCDCPFGLTGPTCTQRLFPACHSTSEPGSLPHYGTWYPKNCYCVKQLRDHPLTCPHYLKYEGNSHLPLSPCLIDIVMEGQLLCYRYKDRPESEQLSDSPPLNATNVEWLHVKGHPYWSEVLLAPERAPKDSHILPDSGNWLPLTECPDRCTGRGWCQTGGNGVRMQVESTEKPWCNCHSYFSGPSCELDNPYHCYRNCSGVGTCQGGWCHCQPGYWGHGCTRRKAYTSSVGWRPNHAAIKIYVYDLPTYVVHRREFHDEWALIDPMYNAELEFTERLLDDWKVRTENPWEASLFFVPTFSYWYTGNIGHPYAIMQHVVHHLQQLGPFFNATAGRNHVMWATNDRGTCELQMAQLELQHPIKIVHFGQTPHRPYARHTHGANNGATGAMSDAMQLPLPGHRFPGFGEFNVGDIMAENQLCIRPEKDVVSPNCLHQPWVEPANYNKVWDTRFTSDGERIVTRRTDDAASRTTTLYFAGYTKDIMMYSQGVRQAIHKMFGDGGKYDRNGPNARKDYLVSGFSGGEAIVGMQKSKFCLAPMGAGWGIRLAEAMVSGCVPVIIQDHIYQPLWDVLPFEEFSIRLSRTDIPTLVEMLDDVTPEQLAALQVGVEKYHRAFMWDTHYGGLAYNYTVTALKRRAISLWSVNFHRHRHQHRLRQ